jgi:hypothetical protein
MSGSVRHPIRRLAGGRTARISRSAATVSAPPWCAAFPPTRPVPPWAAPSAASPTSPSSASPLSATGYTPAGPGRLLTRQPGHGQRGAPHARGCCTRSSPTTASWSASTHASAGQPDGRHPDRAGTEQGLDAYPARRASDGGRRAHHRRWPLAVPRAACTCRRPTWRPASKPRAPAGSCGEPVWPVDHGRGGLDLPDPAQLQARWRAARLQPRLPVRARSRRGPPGRAALTLAVTPSAGQPPWRRRGSSISPRPRPVERGSTTLTAATTGDGGVSSLPSATRPAPRPQIQLGA